MLNLVSELDVIAAECRRVALSFAETDLLGIAAHQTIESQARMLSALAREIECSPRQGLGP